MVITKIDEEKITWFKDRMPAELLSDLSRSSIRSLGSKRLTACLNEHSREDGQQLLNAVINSVDEFVGNADQFDDMTSVLIEIRRED